MQNPSRPLDIIRFFVYYNSNDRQRRVSVQALKHNSVPVGLVMRSFREGLCNETSSWSRQKPKENAQNRLVMQGVFFVKKNPTGKVGQLDSFPKISHFLS